MRGSPQVFDQLEAKLGIKAGQTLRVTLMVRAQVGCYQEMDRIIKSILHAVVMEWKSCDLFLFLTVAAVDNQISMMTAALITYIG